MQRFGKQNGRFDGGKSSDYRRRVMGLSTGDGKVVHHKDKNKSNNQKSNFGVTTRGGHNKKHKEKGGYHP
ncbi:MAG TPA: hypothetical protein ENH46_04700 [Candidatus Pacearchaeota archaeon]|nr:hypothetical protein [Candidatus Pacearchaeota archaeon]